MNKILYVIVLGALTTQLGIVAAADKRPVTTIFTGTPYVPLPTSPIFDHLTEDIVKLTENARRNDMSNYKELLQKVSANIDLLEKNGESVDSIIKEMAKRLLGSKKDFASYINFGNIYKAKAELEEEESK